LPRRKALNEYQGEKPNSLFASTYILPWINASPELKRPFHGTARLATACRTPNAQNRIAISPAPKSRTDTRGIDEKRIFQHESGQSYEFITAATARLLDCLPYRALFKHRTMTIALGLSFQSLTYISHIDKTLLDERMRLYEVPSLRSRNLSPLGLSP
jgi:hypothetical protein